MNDWRIGDLALCVNDRNTQGRRWNPRLGRVYRGQVYTVEGMFIDCDGDLLLILEGFPRNATQHGGLLHTRFRKIRPSAIKHIEALKDVPLPVRENEHA